MSRASTGTTRKSFSAPGLTSIDLALPPAALQEEFDREVIPVRSLLTNLLDSSSHLRATRDLVLPRLVSGEINVDDLDIQIREAS